MRLSCNCNDKRIIMFDEWGQGSDTVTVPHERVVPELHRLDVAPRKRALKSDETLEPVYCMRGLGAP